MVFRRKKVESGMDLAGNWVVALFILTELCYTAPAFYQ